MGLGAAFEVKEVGKIVRDRTATIKKILRVRIGRAHLRTRYLIVGDM